MRGASLLTVGPKPRFKYVGTCDCGSYARGPRSNALGANVTARGTIFLSHHHSDKALVEEVYAKLDPAVTFYDVKSMDIGQSTLEAMRQGIDGAAVFVLFHSEAAQSAWVDFEKDMAEVNRIVSRHLKVVVHPIGSSTYRTLPDWMKAFMTTSPEFRVNDIVRTVREAYAEALEGFYPELAHEYPGREASLRQVALDVMRSASQTGQALNVLVLSGIQGQGRRTLARQIASSAFRGMRKGGPVFDLARNADAVDWHLRFFEDQRGGITADESKAQAAAFSLLTPDQQADQLLLSLSHWSKLNQPITVASRWGFRDRGRSLRPWLAVLLQKLASRPEIKLILISERRIADDIVQTFSNVAQYNVDPLTDETIEYILTKRIDPKFLKVERLVSVAPKIHGHPATANYVSLLVNGGRSMDSLELLPAPIHAFQDKVLSDIFEIGVLSDLQLKTLKLLSWFPLLSTGILVEAFPDAQPSEVIEGIWELADFSLVEQAEGGKYRVPTLVSSSYRRSTDKYDRESFLRVAKILEDNFRKGDFDVELVDSLLVGIVADKGEIPIEFSGFLTMSNLLTIVESEYYSGLGDPSAGNVHFERATKLGSLAMSMSGSEDARENTLFYAADASVRNRQYPKDMIDYMKARGYSSADYIEGSYLYHKRDRDYPGAEKCLRRALASKNFRLRTVRLLARVFIRQAKFSDALDTLGNVSDDRLRRDVGLVVLKIRALRALRLYDKARELEPFIGDKDDDYGELSMYKAAEAFKKGQYGLARQFIEEARQAPRSNKLTLRLLECAAEVEEGINDKLPETCTIARSAGRDAAASQLLARSALYEGNWRDAEGHMAQITQLDFFDLSLKLRIVDAKSGDFEVASDPVSAAAVKLERDEILRLLALRSEVSRFE